MPTETPTRTRYAVLLFVYLAAFITYLDRVCLSVAAPAIQVDLGISQVEFGWVFTVFYIAYSVFEMPTSWLGDRWGQRLMLVRIVGIVCRCIASHRHYPSIALVCAVGDGHLHPGVGARPGGLRAARLPDRQGAAARADHRAAGGPQAGHPGRQRLH
jgi:MFS family permease